MAGLVVLLFIASVIVGIIGASRPYDVVRIHSRLARAMTESGLGLQWEMVLEGLGQQRYLEYLRRAPQHPEEFACYARRFRRSFTVLAVVAALLSAVSVILLIASLVSL